MWILNLVHNVLITFIKHSIEIFLHIINICKIYILFSYDAPLDLLTIRVKKKNIYKLSYFNNHITF